MVLTVQPQTMTSWKPNCAPMGNFDGRVYYNSRDTTGKWQPYSCLPDGSDEQSVGALGAGHIGICDVGAAGVLLSVERKHRGAVPNDQAQPGIGVYCDVWLQSGSAEPLMLSKGGSATIWAKMSPDGTKVCWAQRRDNAPILWPFLGWQIMILDIPTATVTTLQPGVLNPVCPASRLPFYETYGFSPDGTRILFASDATEPNMTMTQLWSCALDGTDLQPVSHPAKSPWPMVNYCEFADWLPDGGIVFGRANQYWITDPTSTDPPVQLTAGLPGTMGGFTIMDGVMFAGIASGWDAESIDGYTTPLT